MKEKLGQEPAFPAATDDLLTGIVKQNKNPEGMSKRFYAACAAMQGLLANTEMMKLLANRAELASIDWRENLAIHSFQISDEILKQENE